MLKLDVHPAIPEGPADGVKERARFFSAKISERDAGDDKIRFFHSASAHSGEQMFGRDWDNFRSAVAACHSQVVFAVSRQSRIDFAGQDSCSRTSGRKSQGEGSAPGSQLDDLPAIGFWNRINHIGDEETLRRHEAAGLTMFQQAGPEEVQMRFQAVRHDDSLVIISRVPSARPLHLWELSRERSGHGGDHIRLADGIMPEMETVDAGFLAGRRKRRGNCARKTSRAGRSSCLWQNHGDGLAQGFQSERLAENDIHARRRTV